MATGNICRESQRGAAFELASYNISTKQMRFIDSWADQPVEYHDKLCRALRYSRSCVRWPKSRVLIHSNQLAERIRSIQSRMCLEIFQCMKLRAIIHCSKCLQASRCELSISYSASSIQPVIKSTAAIIIRLDRVVCSNRKTGECDWTKSMID